MFIVREGDGGSLVQMVQLALERAGFSPMGNDGIFGGKTKSAVVDFQKSRGLSPDGIVGKNTFKALRPFLVGYTTYKISGGDTLWKIAQKFGSTVELIENSNPDISASNLQIGDIIIVPFNFDLVPTDIAYSSLLCEMICEGLSVRFPFIQSSVAGRSVTGKPLPLIKMGKGNFKTFFNASHQIGRAHV